jgi:hypothetical protein
MTKSRKQNNFRKTRRNKNNFRKTRRNKNKVRKTQRKQNKVRKTQRKQNKVRKTLKGGVRSDLSEGLNDLKTKMNYDLKTKMNLYDKINININIIETFNAIKDAVTGSSFSRSKRRNMAIIEIKIVSTPRSHSSQHPQAPQIDPPMTPPQFYYYLVTFEHVGIKMIKSRLNNGLEIHSAYLLNEYDDNKTLSNKYENSKQTNTTLVLNSSVPNGEIKIRRFGKFSISNTDIVQSIRNLSPMRVRWDNNAITSHERHKYDQVPVQEKEEAEEEKPGPVQEKEEAGAADAAREKFKYTIYLALHSFSSILFRLNKNGLLTKFDALIYNIYDAGQDEAVSSWRQTFKVAENTSRGIENLLLNDQLGAVRNVFIHVLILFYSVVCLDQGTATIGTNSVYVSVMLNVYDIYLTPDRSRLKMSAWIGGGFVDVISFQKYKGDIIKKFKPVQKSNKVLFKKLDNGIGSELTDSRPLISDDTTPKPEWSKETKFQTLLCTENPYCKQHPTWGLKKPQTSDNMDVFFKTLMYTIFQMALDNPNTAAAAARKPQTFLELFETNKSNFKTNICIYDIDDNIKTNDYKRLITNKVAYLKELGTSDSIPADNDDKEFAVKLVDGFTRHGLVDLPIVNPYDP